MVKETIGAAQLLSDTVRSDGMRGLITKLPDSVERPIDRALDKLGTSTGELSQSLQNHLTNAGSGAVATAGAALTATGAFLFGALMMTLALFFLLKNRDELVAWMHASSPLRPGQTRELMDEFSKVGRSVLLSELLTASVQAVVALIGYLIARVPHPAFFFALTFVMAFIPAAGAASVCLLAALFLLVTDHAWFALFLAIYAVVVVGLVDNILKPILMRLVKDGTRMHGGLVFFSLIGGLAAFGAIGLLLGPLAVALFLAMLRIYRRDYLGA
jgi:predicted PurR-regulated permease PerM